MDRACPCLYLDEPCHDQCTCRTPTSSFGCDYCCSYGSVEQRKEKAVQLQKRITEGKWEELRNSGLDIPKPINMDRPLSSFSEALHILKSRGHNAIGVAHMLFDDTFIFEDDREAFSAYRDMNGISRMVGCFYGKERFMDVVKDYEEFYKITPKIYWLNAGEV